MVFEFFVVFNLDNILHKGMIVMTFTVVNQHYKTTILAMDKLLTVLRLARSPECTIRNPACQKNKADPEISPQFLSSEEKDTKNDYSYQSNTCR